MAIDPDGCLAPSKSSSTLVGSKRSARAVRCPYHLLEADEIVLQPLYAHKRDKGVTHDGD